MSRSHCSRICRRVNALKLIGILVVSFAIGCGDETGGGGATEGEAAVGTLEAVPKEAPSSDDFADIGQPYDQQQRLEGAGACFGASAMDSPEVHNQSFSTGGTFKVMRDGESLVSEVNRVSPEHFHLDDPASDLGLPYLADGEERMTITTDYYMETAFVAVNTDANGTENYDTPQCGSEAEPLSLAEFLSRCGDSYASGKLMGAFVYAFAVHPTMTQREFEEVASSGRDASFGSVDGIQHLVELGFDIRFYTYGVPDDVVDEPIEPGATLTAEQIRDYITGLDAVADSYSESFSDPPAWPHDEFGAVLGVTRDAYSERSIHACSGREYDEAQGCYQESLALSVEALPKWRRWKSVAERHLENPDAYDWGRDREEEMEEHRMFVRDISDCLQLSDEMVSTCREQIGQTPDDTTAICSACELPMTCESAESDPGACADNPDRTPVWCRSGAFESEWERIDSLEPVDE
jgi:hypothetical protein